MRRNVLFVFCIFLFMSLMVTVASAQTSSPSPAKKMIVPATAALADATSLVNDAYGSDLAAAKTPEQKAALVTKLLGAAKDEKDSNGRFALLSKAKDIALQAGDCDGAVAAIDGIDAEFEIDAIKMKAEAIRSIMRSARSPQQRKAVAAGADGVAVAALAADRYDIATSMAEVALASARAAGDPESIRSAAAMAEQVRTNETAYAGVQAATAKLVGSPTDPDANLKIGKFRCFIKGEWDAGLPMLALGNDAVLKSLAVRELAGAPGAEDQVKIGDGWWEVASKETGAAKSRAQQHAGAWYTAASPNLAGLLKAKVDARLKLLASPPPAAAGATVVVVADKNKVVDLLKLVDAQRDSVYGTWTMHDGVLTSDNGGCTRLQLLYHPPSEYDFRVDFVRLQNNDRINLILTEDGKNYMAGIGYGAIQNGKKYQFVVRVRKNGIQAFLDGKLVNEWKGYKNLVFADFLQLRDSHCLGLHTWASSTAFSRIEVLEVTGKGEILKP